jgi:3-dehydroquinate synthetase
MQTLIPVLPQVIKTCLMLKASVVQADPEERFGLREILNLGHTFGHACETLSEGQIPHGEAVSLGIAEAFRLACRLHQIQETDRDQVIALLHRYNLPTVHPSCISRQAMVSLMCQDKKSVGSRDSVRLVLPAGSIGHVRIQDVVTAFLLETVLT